jgi:hypothetical protein
MRQRPSWRDRVPVVSRGQLNKTRSELEQAQADAAQARAIAQQSQAIADDYFKRIMHLEDMFHAMDKVSQQQSLEIKLLKAAVKRLVAEAKAPKGTKAKT